MSAESAAPASAAVAARVSAPSMRAPSPASPPPQVDLSAPDAILEPSVLSSLASFLESNSAGIQAKTAKKAVKMIAAGYRGRGDMLRLLGQWSVTAGVATAASVEADLVAAVQRGVAARFEAAVADKVLERSAAQPAWLERIVADPAWEAPLLRLAERHPTSLFLRLCVSLMAEQRREADQGGGGGNGNGVGGADGAGDRGDGSASGSGAGGSSGSSFSGRPMSKPLVSASMRAACLNDLDQFHALLSATLQGILAKCVERARRCSASATAKRKRAASPFQPESAVPVKLEKLVLPSSVPEELAQRMQSMDLEALVHDFLRLASQSEWTYLYAQRVLTSAAVSAPKQAAFILSRLSQDLSALATYPPPPPAALLKAAGAGVLPGGSPIEGSGGEPLTTKNNAVYALDLLLRGIKEEWADVSAVWHVLTRTEQLSPLDVNKLYMRFSGGCTPSTASAASASAGGAGGAGGRATSEVPPVALLRHRLLIRVLMEMLFAPDAPLLSAPVEPSPSAAGGSTGGPAAAAGAGAGTKVSDRYKCVWLLAYACCVRDDRVSNVALQRAVKAVADGSDAKVDSVASHAASAAIASSSLDKTAFDATFPALLRLHELVSNKNWGLRPNALLRHMHAPTNLSSPLFAACAVRWIGTQMTDAAFYDTTYQSTVTPYFLALLGEIINRHPLLRGAVFRVMQHTFNLSPPSLSGFQLIQLRKLLLNMLLHLLHAGSHVVDVLDLVRNEVPRGMDHSLIRHFVVHLLFTTGPPYSRPFLEHTLQLLALPQTVAALQSTMQAALQTARLLGGPGGAELSPASAAAAALLAQAHVAAHTPAARRLLASAELHGDLPPGASTALEHGTDDVTMSDMRAPSPAMPNGESDEPASKRARRAASPATTIGGAESAPGSGSAATGKAARREEKDRLRRAEAARKDDLLRRLTTTIAREPRPLASLSHAPDARDGSEHAVLDFCTLLQLHPDLLRLAPLVTGLQLGGSGTPNGGGLSGEEADTIVRADQCDVTLLAVEQAQLAPPMDDMKLNNYMQILAQYTNPQERAS